MKRDGGIFYKGEKNNHDFIPARFLLLDGYDVKDDTAVKMIVNVKYIVCVETFSGNPEWTEIILNLGTNQKTIRCQNNIDEFTKCLLVPPEPIEDGGINKKEENPKEEKPKKKVKNKSTKK